MTRAWVDLVVEFEFPRPETLAFEHVVRVAATRFAGLEPPATPVRRRPDRDRRLAGPPSPRLAPTRLTVLSLSMLGVRRWWCGVAPTGTMEAERRPTAGLLVPLLLGTSWAGGHKPPLLPVFPFSKKQGLRPFF